MALTALDRALLEGRIKYSEHLLIQDDYLHWIDFLDEVGKDAVREIGKIAVSGELDRGAFSTQGISVKVRNHDLFWLRNPRKHKNLIRADQITEYRIDKDLIKTASYNWKLEESSGTAIYDNIGAKTGVFTAAGGGWVDGPAGFDHALDFDGAATNLLISSMPDLSDFTFACLFKAYSDGEANTGHIIYFGPNCMVYVSDETGGQIKINAKMDYNTTDAEAATTVSAAINTWYRLAVVHDATAKTLKIYLEGVDATDSSVTGVGTKASIAGNWNIGNNGSASVTFDGCLASPIIFNTASSAADIRQLIKYDNKGYFSSWSMHECKITRYYYLAEGSIQPQDIQHFYLKSVEPGSSASGYANLRLVSMAEPLRNSSAKTIKNGLNKYTDWPVHDLFLKLADGVYSPEKISTFDFPGQPVIENFLRSNLHDTSDMRCLSTACRPPGFNSAGQWSNADTKKLVVGARLAHPTDTDIIYFGCNEELYAYHRSRDYYELLTTGDASDLGADFNIRRLWYNSTDSNIWGVAIKDEVWQGYNFPTMEIFKYNISGDTFTKMSPTDAAGSLTRAKFFSGEWCFRIGAQYHPFQWKTFLGQSEYSGVHENHGENLVIPMGQRYTTGIASLYKTARKGSTGILTESALVYPDDFYDPPFDVNMIETTPLGRVTATDEGPLLVQFTIGQTGFIVFNLSEQKIIYANYTYPDEVILYEYDIATDTCSELDINSSGNGHLKAASGRWLQPLCGDQSTDHIIIGSIDWKNTSTDKSIAYLHDLNLSTGALTLLYDASTDVSGHYTGIANPEYFVPLEILRSTAGIVVSLLSRDQFVSGRVTRYCLAQYSGIYTDRFLNPTSRGMFQLRGIDYDSIAGIYYCVETFSGKGKGWDPGADLYDIDNSGDIGEGNISCPLLVVRDTVLDEATIYGVSAPNYEAHFYNPLIFPAGLYRLFKFSKNMFSYIDLFDCENPSELWRWEAYEKLCQACQYMPWWTNDGRLSIVRRPTTAGSPVREFTNADGYIMIDEIWPAIRTDKIINEAIITPYTKEYQAPTIDVALADRSSAADCPFDILNVSIEASPSNFNPIQIIMLANGNGNTFKFKAFFAQIITNVSENCYKGQTTFIINLPGNRIESDITADVTDGDYVSIEDENNVPVLRTITAKDTELQTITIAAPGLPIACKWGQSITIVQNKHNIFQENYTLGSTFTEIKSSSGPGTGISLRITYDAGSPPDMTWKAGDRITIKSNGLQLVRMDGCDQTARDKYSIDNITQGTPVTFNNIDNRFLNVRRAKNMAVYFVKKRKYPPYGDHFLGVMDYSLKYCDVITIQHQVFIDEKNNKISAYIVGMAPLAGKWCDYQYLSVDPVSWYN